MKQNIQSINLSQKPHFFVNEFSVFECIGKGMQNKISVIYYNIFIILQWKQRIFHMFIRVYVYVNGHVRFYVEAYTLLVN